MNQPANGLPAQPWSVPKKILFRVSFLFFSLFIFLFRNEILTSPSPVYEFYTKPLLTFIPWIGHHLFDVSYEIVPPAYGGTYDATYDYIMLFLIVVLTIIGTIAWTLFDRRRTSYKKLYYWLTVFIRYYAVYSMFTYGVAKIYKLQFPFPSLGSLLQPLGTYSPMHISWAFFGYSTGYNYIIGGAEVLSGLLLLFRRTTRIGAILLFVVCGNVLAINMFYDVCLKLISAVLVMIALFLLFQERSRLIDFFFRNRPTMPENEWVPDYPGKWMRIGRLILKYGVTAWLVFDINRFAIAGLSQYGDGRPKSVFYGIYDVRTFVKGKDTLPPLLTDTSRWRRLVLNQYGTTYVASVRLMDDVARSYMLRPDTLAKKLTFYSAADTNKKYYFDYSFTGADTLNLRGTWRGDSVSVTLQKFDLNKFTLINRGFHFINETPYQR